MQQRLQEVLEAIRAANPVAGNAVAEIWLPGRGLRVAAASGIARAGSNEAMTPEHQFHIASIGKTMTAVLVLGLCEDGMFGARGLDARIAELGLFDDTVLERLNHYGGRSHGAGITLRHLLTHTSGLKDAHVDDAGSVAADHGGPAPGSLLARYLRALDQLMRGGGDASGLRPLFRDWVPWDPHAADDPEAGIVNFYLNSIAPSSVGAPGARFHYSDTGYVILGLVVEHVGGAPLHAQLRRRIFDRIGMESTYLAYATDPPARQWERRVSELWLGPVPAISRGLNLSFDWAGGGEVSTAHDLNTFLRALLAGELFRRTDTLPEMLRMQRPDGLPPSFGGIGLGLYELCLPSGQRVLGHGGAWGSAMFHDPASECYFAGTVNVARGIPGWEDHVLALASAEEPR